MTGAEGTPYSRGLWRLQLKIPNDYPKSPPKATFKTRIFHPNVEESTGAVCLETLKRDWDPKLTLKDILVTISCLLIQPNPDSALNATAGSLIQEDYEAFAKQAKLMTSIHAPIPSTLSVAVREAKRRGEDIEKDTVQKRSHLNSNADDSVSHPRKSAQGEHERPDLEEEHGEAKENHQTQCPASPCPLSPRKRSLGKRPLSELALEDLDSEGTGQSGNTNTGQSDPIGIKEQDDDRAQSSVRKSPKLAKQHSASEVSITSNMDATKAAMLTNTAVLEEEKENVTGTQMCKGVNTTQMQPISRPSLRKVSNVGAGRGNFQPRMGIRRL